MEFQNIANFLLDLMPSPDTWKDYIFPTLQTFIATMAGAGSAYYLFLRQEQVLEGRKNIAAANQVVVIAHSAIQDLIRVKAGYADTVRSLPFQRASSMPTQVTGLKRISFPIHDLGFLVPWDEASIDHSYLHVQILYLDGLSANYNMLCDFLELRAKLDGAVRGCVSEHISKGASINMDANDLVKIVPNGDLINWVDASENCFVLIDGLIQQLDKILRDFPVYANRMAMEKGCSKKDRVHKVNLPVAARRFIDLIPDVDYAALAKILNIPVEVLVARYDKGLL